MQIMKRSVRVMGLLIVLALSLTGCVRADLNVNVKADGSGNYTQTYGISKQLAISGMDQFMQELDDQGKTTVSSKGGTYRVYSDNDYGYVEWKHDFKNVDELNGLLKDAFSSQDSLTSGAGSTTGNTTNDSSLQASKSGDQIHITGKLDFTIDTSSLSALGGSTIDPATMFKDAYIRVAVTMPHIASHQGGSISGNTVTYTVKYNEKATVDVVGGPAGLADNIGAIGMVGGGVVLLAILAGGAFFFMRRRNSTLAVAGSPMGDALPMMDTSPFPPTELPPQPDQPPQF
jgi:hypothetical protein